MTLLDWAVIIAYLGGMIALSVRLGRRQRTHADYYVGGRRMPWWAVGLSTMATQTGAISFISIPAFVALKPGGGLTWLQYELAVPLAVIGTMVLLVPFFRKLRLISVYEYLELRYSPGVRHLVGLIFLVSRGLGTGVGVYASAIVLSVCLDLSLELTILIIGGVTVIYDTIGGMRAVIFSDVIQMLILVAGIGVCVFYAASLVGGLGAILSSFPSARAVALDPSHGFNDGGTAPFWAFLLGGLFLYLSYYGVDQSQVQRELSATTEEETRYSLMLNGFARFPLTLLYVAMGMALWAVYQQLPELRQSVSAARPDELVPQFILLYLPPGLRALVFAAILAAAMSSLDSAINSLSAVTVHDFLGRRWGEPGRHLWLGKMTTVIWGAIITGAAFAAQHISGTVIEAVNKVGSAFYGPVLAVFVVGLLCKRATPAGALAGLVAGVGGNLWLWACQPGIHWMWWNLVGFAVTALIGLLSGLAAGPGAPPADPKTLVDRERLGGERPWLWSHGALVAYFVLMLLVVAWL